MSSPSEAIIRACDLYNGAHRDNVINISELKNIYKTIPINYADDRSACEKASSLISDIAYDCGKMDLSARDFYNLNFPALEATINGERTRLYNQDAERLKRLEYVVSIEKSSVKHNMMNAAMFGTLAAGAGVILAVDILPTILDPEPVSKTGLIAWGVVLGGVAIGATAIALPFAYQGGKDFCNYWQDSQELEELKKANQ